MDVFKVEGYQEPWFVVTTALDLRPEDVQTLVPARYRQENGFREHKQWMGMEECMAWTKEPVLRTFQVQMMAITLLRLLQFRLEESKEKGTWWEKPPWNPRKKHGSILDLRRLLWKHREELSQLMQDLEDLENFTPDLPNRQFSNNLAGLSANKRAACRYVWLQLGRAVTLGTARSRLESSAIFEEKLELPILPHERQLFDLLSLPYMISIQHVTSKGRGAQNPKIGRAWKNGKDAVPP